MPSTEWIEKLLAATKSVSTTFGSVPRDPVPIPDPRAAGAEQVGEVARRYWSNGFALVELAGGTASPDTLEALARALGLGPPFVPPLYAAGGNRPAPVARISAAGNAGTVDAAHPSFGRSVGQPLHCDGTLQEIGHVRTSLLLCATPAADGGVTTLFNASAAYAQLAAEDVDAAVALATPGALVRQANINGCTDLHAGPAFGVQDGEIVSRYSVTATDRWEVPDGVAAADLWRGVAFLGEAATAGGDHYTELTLRADQAIVLANSRIAHGRTGYRDSATARRCLYRSLHLRHPLARPDRDAEW